MPSAEASSFHHFFGFFHCGSSSGHSAAALFASLTGGVLLELQAAVGARAVDQRGRGAARRAGQVLGVSGGGDLDRGEALAQKAVAPVGAHQLGEAG